MAHAREQIRDAVVAQLGAVPGVTTIRARRVRPIAAADLPLLEVGTPIESSAVDTMSPVFAARSLTLVIAVYFLGIGIDENDADDIAEAIEVAIGNTLPVASAPDLQMTLTETSLELETESSDEAARLLMTYVIGYETAVDDPTIITE